MIDSLRNQYTVLVVSSILFSSQAHADIALPSSAPVDVYSGGQYRGYGVMQMKIVLDLKDDGYDYLGTGSDELDIGKVDFDVKGLMYKRTDREGSRFETAYTIGTVEGKLKQSQFTTATGSYNNSYDESGLFVGYIPAYSGDLYLSDQGGLDVKYAYNLNTMLYYIQGDYRINVYNPAIPYNGGNYSVGYTESSYGIAFKPTAVIQPTWYVTENFAITLYAGATAFAEVNINDWENSDYSSEYDTELSATFKNIKPLYGYDISIRNILGRGDIFNLSSAFAGDTDEEEDLAEITLLYKIPVE